MWTAAVRMQFWALSALYYGPGMMRRKTKFAVARALILLKLSSQTCLKQIHGQPSAVSAGCGCGAVLLTSKLSVQDTAAR